MNYLTLASAVCVALASTLSFGGVNAGWFSTRQLVGGSALALCAGGLVGVELDQDVAGSRFKQHNGIFSHENISSSGIADRARTARGRAHYSPSVTGRQGRKRQTWRQDDNAAASV